MDLDKLLQEYKRGMISEKELLAKLKMDHLQTMEDRFRYDISREARTGFPEAVLAIRKSAEDIAKIVKSVVPVKGSVLVTKLDEEKMEKVRSMLEEECSSDDLQIEYHRDPELLLVRGSNYDPPQKIGCSVGIIAAGTSDIPIAEEARLILDESGIETLKAYDVGVAGLHRIFPPVRRMLDEGVDVLIVVAGMEGALPSVVKGLVDLPVIGVPSSVGYGYEAGRSALIAMLNSCVPGITVTNIDNGFGAAAAAHSICRRISVHK